MRYLVAAMVASVGVVFAGNIATAGEPIRLKPGQCVMIGSQEVCAMLGDAPAVEAATQTTKLASCRYGDRIDDPKLKGWTLYQIVIGADGKKTETAIKSFGNFDSDKSECERERAALDAKIPR